MKIKLTLKQLGIFTKILQSAEDSVDFSNDYEKNLTVSVLTEIIETCLIKIIKQKENNSISLKPYHVMAVQVAIISYKTDDAYCNAIAYSIIQQTDLKLMDLGLI